MKKKLLELRDVDSIIERLWYMSKHHYGPGPQQGELNALIDELRNAEVEVYDGSIIKEAVDIIMTLDQTTNICPYCGDSAHSPDCRLAAWIAKVQK